MNALFFLLACPRPAPEPVLPVLEEPDVLATVDIEPRRDFAVVNGTWGDHQTGLELEVLEGWTGRVGEAQSDLRITLRHVATGSLVEVRALGPGASSPRERLGCDWEFSDQGAYGGLRVTGSLTTSTCIPDNPSSPRVLAYISCGEELCWHLEAVLSQGYMAISLEAIRELLGTFRLP